MTSLHKSLLASSIASIGTLGALSAFAQGTAVTEAYSCAVNLAYSPVVATAVPGLGMLGVGTLAGLIGVMAWRKRKSGSLRALSVVFMMGAAVLATQGGNSLVQTVRAADPYAMDSSTGGTVATTMNLAAVPGTQTVVNNTAVRMKIVTNANSSETAAGSCAVNAEIAPGTSCTTQAVCTPLQVLRVASEPAVGCDLSGPPLDKFEVSFDGGGAGNDHFYFYSFMPTITSAPVFDPITTQEPTVVFSAYAPNATWKKNATGTYLEDGNLEAVGSGTATITATAPAGYVFTPSLSSTYTFSTAYSGCSISESTPN